MVICHCDAHGPKPIICGSTYTEPSQNPSYVEHIHKRHTTQVLKVQHLLVHLKQPYHVHASHNNCAPKFAQDFGGTKEYVQHLKFNKITYIIPNLFKIWKSPD